MTKTLQGTIRGRMIELTDDPGLVEGATVEVVVRATEPVSPTREGLRRLAGSLADIPGLDEDLDEIIGQRKVRSARDEHE